MCTLVQHLLAARTYPAAVLVASVPGRYPLGPMLRTTVRRPTKTLESIRRHDLLPLVDTPRAAQRTLFSPTTPDDTIRRVQRRLTTAAPHVIRELMLTPPARPRLATPVLLLAATGDRVFVPAKQRHRARAIGADYVEIVGSGHDIPLDHQWRPAVDTASAWLAARLSDASLTPALRK